jgi:hypothetical protein
MRRRLVRPNVRDFSGCEYGFHDVCVFRGCSVLPAHVGGHARTGAITTLELARGRKRPAFRQASAR